MVGRSTRTRSKPTPPAAPPPAASRRPVEIINCFDDDDDVIIEENGDKEGEQLVMECEEEELTPEQQRAYELAEKEFESYESQIRQYREANVSIVEMNNASNSNGNSPVAAAAAVPTRPRGRPSAVTPTRGGGNASRRQATPRTPQPPPPPPSIPSPAESTRGTRSSARASLKAEEMITLLVDSKTGGVIGSVPESAVATLTLPPGTTLHRAPKSTMPNAVPLKMTTGSGNRGRGGKRQVVMPAPTRVAQPPSLPAVRGGRGGSAVGRPPTRGTVAAASPVVPPPSRGTPQTTATVRTVELKPTQNANKPSRGPLAPFPTLFTFPKPFYALPSNVAQNKRTELDAKVKALLVYSPSKFTEWLIQAGLLRSKQNCTVHKTPKGEPLPLKLAMYNDSTKFPSTGGYVWISDCCPERFVSVFRGSIFEGQNHPPVTVLKLIYHWACQTNPSNVMSWVKTEAHYINGFYRLMKSLCALAVYTQIPKFGGPGKTLEAASVHLYSAGAAGRANSVEIFCLFDRSTRLVRLLAVDRGRTSSSSRYAAYRQYLGSVVHPRSTIVVDTSLEVGPLAGALPNARFVPGGLQAENAVNYLTKHVPKIFANTLGTLNIAQVQPFLDELAWREKWGRSAADAYDNVVALLASETKNSDKNGEALIPRLSKIASSPAAKTLHQMVPASNDEIIPASPAKRGAAAVASPPAAVPRQGMKVKRAAPGASPSPRGPAAAPVAAQVPGEGSRSALEEHASAAKRFRPPEMVKLADYYYGQMAATKSVTNTNSSAFKCPVCQKIFNFNVAFTRHLFMHLESARSFSIDLGDLTLCKYCFRNFGTPYAMQTHVEEVHLRRHNSLVCGICNEPFKNRMELIGHMHINHVQAELPYGCELCGFRSSFHRCLLDHFENAHSESDRLLCHYCLKTYTNRGVFFQHIQKHQGKKDQTPGSKNKCRKCCLSFQKAEHLRDHLQKDHISYTGFKGLEASSALEPGTEEIMMPKPDEKKRRKGPPVFFPAVYPSASLNLVPMKKADDPVQLSKLKCQECKRPLDKSHFKTAWSCSHCRYNTFCDFMAQSHVAMFHGAKPDFDMSKPECLKKTMFCVCGFGSYSGNKLATHLALCGKKSAYPSRHRASLATVSAQSATFPELITLDEEEDEDGEDYGAGDSFDDGDFGAAGDHYGDDLGDCSRGGNGGQKSEQGGRSHGVDGKKKKRRRRHGAEDINSVWLKAIWASQNLPVPGGSNGDNNHADDFEYVDEETPDVLQAVGLHKHGACKKVRKVPPAPSPQPPKKSADGSPEPFDALMEPASCVGSQDEGREETSDEGHEDKEPKAASDQEEKVEGETEKMDVDGETPDEPKTGEAAGKNEEEEQETDADVKEEKENGLVDTETQPKENGIETRVTEVEDGLENENEVTKEKGDVKGDETEIDREESHDDSEATTAAVEAGPVDTEMADAEQEPCDEGKVPEHDERDDAEESENPALPSAEVVENTEKVGPPNEDERVESVADEARPVFDEPKEEPSACVEDESSVSGEVPVADVNPAELHDELRHMKRSEDKGQEQLDCRRDLVEEPVDDDGDSATAYSFAHDNPADGADDLVQSDPPIRDRGEEPDGLEDLVEEPRKEPKNLEDLEKPREKPDGLVDLVEEPAAVDDESSGFEDVEKRQNADLEQHLESPMEKAHEQDAEPQTDRLDVPQHQMDDEFSEEAEQQPVREGSSTVVVQNGDQLPDFSEMADDEPMDVDVSAGFSLDQFS